MPLKHSLSWVMTRVSVERNLSSQAMTARRCSELWGWSFKALAKLLLVGLLVGGGGFTSKLVGVIGTVTNTRRPLPESNQAAAAECHRPAPARASPRTISPIPEESSARLVSRSRPLRGLSPPQYSAPNLAAGAAGDEGAAHKPPRRARPLSRGIARASKCRWTAMARPTRRGSVVPAQKRKMISDGFGFGFGFCVPSTRRLLDGVVCAPDALVDFHTVRDVRVRREVGLGTRARRDKDDP
jgi:hypothetical protein